MSVINSKTSQYLEKKVKGRYKKKAGGFIPESDPCGVFEAEGREQENKTTEGNGLGWR